MSHRSTVHAETVEATHALSTVERQAAGAGRDVVGLAAVVRGVVVRGVVGLAAVVRGVAGRG
ncbi:hypothetical protein J7E45_13470, partial [Microbacterium sp. ISL-59]|uniref:hypothetical protein n=1 Tax=Microbacterium sp. ISL-59 TaxID=2819159 RepID=UPI001BEB4FF5